MTVTVTKYRCGKCRMEFVVQPLPTRKWAAEYTFCAEPECDQRFWHTGHSHSGNKCSVGVHPDDIPR